MSRPSGFSRSSGFLGKGHQGALVKGAAVALLFSVTCGPARGEEAAASLSREVKDLWERASKAVVKIHGMDEHSEIVGTGFFIDPTGTIYTSYAVGGEADNFTVEFEGKKYSAQPLLADMRSEVAMLKIDAVTPALPIGKSNELEVATPVVAIGFPLDLRQTPSFGMIGGFDRKYLGRYFPTTKLRVNMATQRGEAGAPLLNFKGEVVGILVSSLENSSSCYALPIEAAEKVRGDFIRFGEVRHGWVGVQVKEADTEVEGSRTEITDLLGPAPAADAGLRPGDILLQVGKVQVLSPEDVLDASFFITAGDTVPITVVRKGEKITLNVQADYHPATKKPPLIGSEATHRGIPLNLQAAPVQTP